MRPVTVLILHPPLPDDATRPLRWLDAAREAIAQRHRAAFEAAGAEHVRIVSQPADETPFGARIRALAREVVDGTPGGQRHGLVLIGSGALPLARREDLAEYVRVGHGIPRGPAAIANSYYSADAVAVSDAAMLINVPDLPADNALPRWLSERAGVPVRDQSSVSRLGIDIDSPLDVVLIAGDPSAPWVLGELADEILAACPALVEGLRGIAATLQDRRSELLVAGRSSARTLRWLEQHAACRVRAFIEERGMRSSSPLALGDLDDDRRDGPAVPAETLRFAPPRSVLGLLLEESGPRLLTSLVAQLGDAAILDTRVLLAHRFGLDETRWPPLADRLASDLLLPGDIDDPWLRQITRRALEHRAPILLGGHTLVGPGLPLIPGAVAWLDRPPGSPEPPPEPPAPVVRIEPQVKADATAAPPKTAAPRTRAPKAAAKAKAPG